MVLYCEIDLRIPMAQSLKDKRSIIKSLQEKLRNKFNIAISELGNNDLWKRTKLGVVTVSNDIKHSDRVFQKVIDFIEEFYQVQVINYDIERK